MYTFIQEIYNRST